MPATTFTDLLTGRLARDRARPLVTFYDHASGERIELSAATYANWVAKTAGLLQDDLDLEPGSRVLVDLPTHWLGAVWLGAAWSAGLCVTTQTDRLDHADAVVCGPKSLEAYADAADRRPVVAVSLRPLGGRFVDPLPGGVIDYATVVLAQPDVFVATDTPSPDHPAWLDDLGMLTQGQLVAAAATAGVTPGGGLLTDVNPCSRDGLDTLLGPLARDAATVWVRHPDPALWRDTHAAERVTDELRASGTGDGAVDQSPRS